MTAKLSLAVALAGALMLAAAQPAAATTPLEPGEPKRQCFWANRVNNFASADGRTVNVRVGVKDVYQFEMFGRCHDVDWSHRIALVSRTGSSICSGFDAEIVTPSAIGPQRCPIRNVRKLTPAEIKALPKRARP